MYSTRKDFFSFFHWKVVLEWFYCSSFVSLCVYLSHWFSFFSLLLFLCTWQMYECLFTTFSRPLLLHKRPKRCFVCLFFWIWRPSEIREKVGRPFSILLTDPLFFFRNLIFSAVFVTFSRTFRKLFFKKKRWKNKRTPEPQNSSKRKSLVISLLNLCQHKKKILTFKKIHECSQQLTVCKVFCCVKWNGKKKTSSHTAYFIPH